MTVEHLVTGSTTLTPEMALDDAKNFDLTDVIIVGYQEEGDDAHLVVRTSHITRAEAIYLLLKAIDHCKGDLNENLGM
ncbi:hypothetical protein KAR91_02570 [Candidatus Pacearchaeota archaeon]|nr:hypothetical protein [Candidatus Pacearchaeota archaeon]